MEDLSDEVKSKLRERQTELIAIIEALVELDRSKSWNVLKELIFDKSVTSIERQMLSESLALEIKVERIYKLQGEWAWAKQFGDTDRFVEMLKKQLEDINNKLK